MERGNRRRGEKYGEEGIGVRRRERWEEVGKMREKKKEGGNNIKSMEGGNRSERENREQG